MLINSARPDFSDNGNHTLSILLKIVGSFSPAADR